ncbi:MAG: phytanoyl-CoA dioxygenase family protein [Candidatus Poribacteria bacterium]|nr:phytanoyl-CoA dioxygenase family protein [Candidatus Poribacteria bacterium]
MILEMGKREMELGGSMLGHLRDSTNLMGDPHALRERMRDDGYLFLRQLHDPKKVMGARRVILKALNMRDDLDKSRPIDEGVLSETGKGRGFHGFKPITHDEDFLALVEAPELMDFFTEFLDGDSMTYDWKWVRAVGSEEYSGAHYDIVYMGRGTENVFTLWTPLGDVTYDMAPLCFLEGSNKLDILKRTYGKMDVDRDHVTGSFSNDPVEMVERYGGRWLTSEFQAGDALIFSMYTMHGSLKNKTNRYRLSTDTRYQRADEPVDERWIGREPKGHYGWFQGKTVTMEEARKEWGV